MSNIIKINLKTLKGDSYVIEVAKDVIFHQLSIYGII